MIARGEFHDREDAINEEAKKTTLRMIPYGISLLTADEEKGHLGAATVNRGTQSAFAPPLLAVGLKTDSGTYRIVKGTKTFALSMRGKEHQGMAFASFKPTRLEDDKPSRQSVRKGVCGAPIPDAAPAAVECAGTSSVEEGDRHIVVGEGIEAHRNTPIAGCPDTATLEMKELGDNVFYGG
jgi:flavin reductase (DIM6/NTAB) family NADH-FMN oxidoreductase RutF